MGPNFIKWTLNDGKLLEEEGDSKVICSVEFESVYLCAFSVILCVTIIYKITQRSTEDSRRFTEVF